MGPMHVVAPPHARPFTDRAAPDTEGPGMRRWHANADRDADVQLQEMLRPSCSAW
jgi:hypothetical protein